MTHHTTPAAENPMANPIDSIMAMFLMSLYNFGNTYEAFGRTEHETVAKVFRRIFFLCVLLEKCVYVVGSLRHLHGNCRHSSNQHVDRYGKRIC